MQKQINILSDVLEKTVFCTNIPFKLTGRAFQFLTDIFLFYDFSVENFLHSYKVLVYFILCLQFFFISYIRFFSFKLSLRF